MPKEYYFVYSLGFFIVLKAIEIVFFLKFMKLSSINVQAHIQFQSKFNLPLILPIH